MSGIFLSMIIIELTYKASLDQVEQYLQAHRDFLDRYYKEKIFIASGAKEPRTGGIILAMSDKKDIQAIIEEDHFYRSGIADYNVIEFNPSKMAEDFKALIQ
jgi:uncharacterized protein YciI